MPDTHATNPTARRTQQFERDVHHVRRDDEFFTVEELTKQIGHPRPMWAAAILKELIDNALDAAEKRPDTTPEVTVVVNEDSIVVRDNGPGIPPEVIEQARDFSKRVSDKVAYVGPSRGQQGFGLKTIYAVGFVEDGHRGEVGIEVGERRYDVRVTRSDVTGPHSEIVERERAVKTGGTSVEVRWPQVSSLLLSPGGSFYDSDAGDDDELIAASMRDVIVLARAYSVFNPHAHFRLRLPDQPHLDFPPLAPRWGKWATNSALPVSWYSVRRFTELLAHTFRTKPARPVRDFVGTFYGLKGTQKQKAVCEEAGIADRETITGLFPGGRNADTARVGMLHAAMLRHATKTPKPDDLGLIGKPAFERGLEGLFGAGEVKYKRQSGVSDDGRPWLVEVALGVLDYDCERVVLAGVNFSPALGIPFDGLSDALQRIRAGESEPVVVAVHVAFPGATATDAGKSRYDLPPAAVSAVRELVGICGKEWKKRKDRDDRDSERITRAAHEEARRERPKRMSIKEACFTILPRAYRESRGGMKFVKSRMFQYRARDLVQEYIGDKWFKNDGTFSNVVQEYMRQNPEETADWDVVFDDRGHFREPHTGLEFGLGTIPVREYIRSWRGAAPTAELEPFTISRRFATRGPHTRFKFALIIEKEGFDIFLRRAGIEERYDVAIIGGKGHSVTATRTLIEALSKMGVTCFVLHDFDREGLGISHGLRESNERFQYAEPPRVIDIGLRLADVKRLGLKPERRKYRMQKDPRILLRKKYKATPEEIEYLVGKRCGPKEWAGQRVELNAILPADKFIEFVESKLNANGVHKVVPDPATLEIAYQRAHRTEVLQTRLDAAIREINAAPVPPAPDDITARVQARLEKHRTEAWDDALAAIVREDVTATPA